MKMILPIKYSYVPTWGLWEAVREIVQNGQDEKEQNGSPLRVRHNGEFLIVENDGAEMDRKVLLLGQTSKEGRGLRGHFGEGLNLAMLAAVRAGNDMQVVTSTEIWTPLLESRAEYGNETVLVVNIKKRKRTQTTKHVHVRIKMSAEEWAELESRFLFLNPPKRMFTSREGSILMDEKHVGCYYSKGIFVTRTQNAMQFGYDFANIELDRDRRMIDPWNAEYTMANILGEAMAQKPEMFIEHVFDMLSSDSAETKNLKYHLPKDSEALKLLTQEFERRNGDGSLPVSNMSESREIEHYGKRGVVVGTNLAEVLQKQTGTFQAIQQELRMQTVKRYSWSELSEEEQATVLWAEERLREIGIENLNITIADFAQEDIHGLASTSDGKIQIRRADLWDKFTYLSTLVHEVSHVLEHAGDGEHQHVAKIEDIWCKLYRAQHKVS